MFQQRPQTSIIMLIVIVSVLLAIATSIALLALSNRPGSTETAVDQPQGEIQIINVEGVDVSVRRTTDNALFIQPITIQPEAGLIEQPTQEVEVPQEQPAQEQPVVQEQPAQEQPVVQEQPAPTTAVSGLKANTSVDSIILQSYQVQANDSLYNITRQLNTSITLMAARGISQSNLVVGTLISVPVGNPAYCPSMLPYPVAEGDTIYSIARRRNTTPENLRNINNLDANYTIYGGTIICVP